MTTLVYLDIDTLEIETKQSVRDHMDLLKSSQHYYAKKGIRTMLGRRGNVFFVQERECKNILLLVTEEGYTKQDLNIVKERLTSLPYYAVSRGYMPGLFRTWSQCKDSTDGFTGRRYKKFAGREAAIQFMMDNNAPLVSYDYLMK